MKLYMAQYYGHRLGRYGTESGIIGAFSSTEKAEEASEELLKSDDWLFLNYTFECWKLDEISEQVLKS